MTNNEKLFREIDKTIISKIKILNGDFILVKEFLHLELLKLCPKQLNHKYLFNLFLYSVI